MTIRTTIRQPDELMRHVDRTAPTRRRSAARPGALPLIVREAARGHRAFVVVPLVQEDEAGDRDSVEAAAKMLRRATGTRRRTDAGVPGSPPAIEIVHGQMKASERDERMERFRSGETPMLVGTTVLEVGVDVPEATVMLILDADRFGLAQLHQLRGRVGRGEEQAYCVLVSSLYPGRSADESSWTDEQRLVKARLDAVAGHSDGFVLAEPGLRAAPRGRAAGPPAERPAAVARRVAGGGRHRALSVEARKLAERIVDAEGRLKPDLRGSPAGVDAAGWPASAQATSWRRVDADGRSRSARGDVLPPRRARCLTPAGSSPVRPAACGCWHRGPARGRCRTGSSRRSSPRWIGARRHLAGAVPRPVRRQRRGRHRGAQPGRAERRVRRARPGAARVIGENLRRAHARDEWHVVRARRSSASWPAARPSRARRSAPWSLDPPYGDTDPGAPRWSCSGTRAGWLRGRCGGRGQALLAGRAARARREPVLSASRRFGETVLSFLPPAAGRRAGTPGRSRRSGANP